MHVRTQFDSQPKEDVQDHSENTRHLGLSMNSGYTGFH